MNLRRVIRLKLRMFFTCVTQTQGRDYCADVWQNRPPSPLGRGGQPSRERRQEPRSLSLGERRTSPAGTTSGTALPLPWGEEDKPRGNDVRNRAPSPLGRGG